jgi:hypothetical protein
MLSQDRAEPRLYIFKPSRDWGGVKKCLHFVLFDTITPRQFLEHPPEFLEHPLNFST